MNPMQFRHLALAGIAAFAAALLPVGAAQAQKKGGDAVVAQQAQPPSLDAMTTFAQASRNITMHMFETLFARNEKADPIPDLATGHTVSADGMTYVFNLRQGVKFHNGKEMTSEDVKASLERYGKYGASNQIMSPVAGIEATSKYVVTVKLKTPVPGFVEQLSSPRAPAAIIPAEEAGKEPNKINLIGTGPFEFVEYKPDSHVKLKRFENYSANMNYKERDGFGGRKTAWFNTVTFRFVPEAGARTSGLQAGESHVLEALPAPAAKRLKDDKNVRVYEVMPWAFQTIMFNASQAPTNNPKVREAIRMALNMEEIMAISTDGLYRMTHGWQHPGTSYFAGDVGKELYNVNNPAKAKELLKEAGYKGEELLLIADNSFKNHNDTAVVAAQQLQAIGLNVKLRVTDWPTVVASRQKKEGWNAFPIMVGIEPYEGPYGMTVFFTGPNNWQFEQDKALEEAAQKLNTSARLEDRQAAFAAFQKRLYETVYSIKIGDLGIYQAARANVANFKPHRIPRMWDVWFE